jgi:AraC-like DNA-binding protein
VRRLSPAHHAISGFHAHRPVPAVPQLVDIGEEWLASRTDIADHAHEFWEVYLQLDGEADWHDRGRATTLGPGGGYLVAPGVSHHLGRVRGVRHHFVFAILDVGALVSSRLKEIAPLAERARRHGRLFTGPAEALRAPFRLLVAAVTRGSPHRDLAVAIAVDALCVAMLEWAVEPEAPSLRPEHRAVALVRERVDAAPGRKWTLAELAQDTGLTAKHLCTVFGRQVGQTPHQYLLAARLDGIKRALAETDLSITQLAEDYGFASSQHLARVFAAKVGCSARAFRAEQRRAKV